MLKKADIRRDMLAKRAALNENEIIDAALKIAKRLKSLNLNIENIGAYVPICGEVDALRIMEALHCTQISLPCVENQQKILIFRQWAEGDTLVTGAHNILCPDVGAAKTIPDCILVPLVAFDTQGFRLGYGGGYYDTTLTALKQNNPNILAIGLAHDFQQVDTLPIEPHDVGLDIVITENQILDWRR